MKKTMTSIITLSLMLWLNNVNAQRYLTEIYTDAEIEVTLNVQYGENLSIMPTVYAALTGGDPAAPAVLPLMMDVYQPKQSVDTNSSRPLIIYLPTGNFLPRVMNGAATGDKSDSSAVNIAKQLAKRGYVCAVANYRLGWNPVATDQIVRTGTLLNAAYKGMQDSKAAVRFFRKDKATDNAYKIDAEKIALIGEGTGGYVALIHGYYDNGAKSGLLPGVGEDKFLNDDGNSLVDTNRIGRLDGTDAIPVDLTDFAISGGDFFMVKGNIANNPEYSSEVNGIINLGGALGDSSWLDRGQIPLIGVHAVRDPNAPYNIGDVIVPTTGDVVIPFASGSGENVFRMNEFGNNDVFANKIYNDPITLSVEANYNKTIPFGAGTIDTRSGAGLLPFILPNVVSPITFNHGSPWQFWNSNQPQAQAPSTIEDPANEGSFLTIHQVASMSNPYMAASNAEGRNVALTYIDTIQQYIQPRLVCVLGLPECDLFETVSVKEINKNSYVSVFPNPSNDNVNIVIKNQNNKIMSVNMFDISGRNVRNNVNVNAPSFLIERGGLKAGIYFVNIETSNGTFTQKVILN